MAWYNQGNAWFQPSAVVPHSANGCEETLPVFPNKNHASLWLTSWGTEETPDLVVQFHVAILGIKNFEA